MGKRSARRQSRIEDQLLDSDNLLAVTEFLQLAEQGLNLLNESFFLCTLKLTKDFFYHSQYISTENKKENEKKNDIRIT